MKLPKHNLPKNKATRSTKKVSRTSKHKILSFQKPQQAGMEIENDDIETEKQEDLTEQPVQSNEQEKTDDKKYIPGLKLLTKEEKQKIRKARKKSNSAKHGYKIRNHYCTGKNGPRAINRVSLQ